MKSSKRPIGLLAILGIVLTLGLCTYMYVSTGRPRPGSVEYEEYTRAFQVGLAALDSDVIPQAEENLIRCTTLLPPEPAAWANLGLLYLRSGQLEQSNKCLARASELSPDSTAIAKLIAHLRQRQGQFDQAATILKKVIEAEPADVRSLYQLIQVIDQQSQSGAEEEQFDLLDRLLKIEPQNTRLLIDRLRAAIRDRRADEVHTTVEELDRLSSAWQDRTVKALEDLKQALEQGPTNANPPSLLRFTNTLLAESSFVRDSSRLEAQDAFVGQPLEDYLWLSPLQREPAIADLDLTFQPQKLALQSDRTAKFLSTFWSTTNAKVAVVQVGDNSLRLNDIELSLDPKKGPNTLAGVIALDTDNDLYTDIVIAGQGGLQFFRSQAGKTFQDVTEATGLEESTLTASFVGGCAVDFDLDGDLDILLYPSESTPTMLRNNFDGSYTELLPFAISSPIRTAE